MIHHQEREIDGIAVASPPDAIPLAEPPYFVCTVPAVTGKVEEVVASATIAFPDPSTAMAAALSSPCPPTYVAYMSVLPEALSFATKLSPPNPDTFPGSPPCVP